MGGCSFRAEHCRDRLGNVSQGAVRLLGSQSKPESAPEEERMGASRGWVLSEDRLWMADRVLLPRRGHGDMETCTAAGTVFRKGLHSSHFHFFCSCHHQEGGTGSAPLSHSLSVPRFPRVPSTPTRPEHQGTRGLVRTQARWEQAVLIPHHPRGALPAPTSPGRSLPHFSCRSWGWSESCAGGGCSGVAPVAQSHPAAAHEMRSPSTPAPQGLC